MNKWLDRVALRILAHVRERQSISFYSRELDISTSAINQAMRELEKSGLIERVRVKKSSKIALTVRGQIAQEQIWALNRLLERC